MSARRERSAGQPDEALLDRFFERQRHEIVGRIRAREAARRRRAPLLGLAASALLAALLGAGVLGGGPAAPDELAGLELFTMPSYVSGPDASPLSAFGDWDAAVGVTDAGPLAAFDVHEAGTAGYGATSPVYEIPPEWLTDSPETNPVADSGRKG